MIHQNPSPENTKTACSLKQTVPNSQNPSGPILLNALVQVKRIPQRDGSTLFSLVVKRCPLCSKQHVHGGGSGERPILGTRVSHCLQDCDEYLLVDAEGGAA